MLWGQTAAGHSGLGPLANRIVQRAPSHGLDPQLYDFVIGIEGLATRQLPCDLEAKSRQCGFQLLLESLAPAGRVGVAGCQRVEVHQGLWRG
jgi:hypothetical protein